MDSWLRRPPHIFTNSMNPMQVTSHSPRPMAVRLSHCSAIRISSSSSGSSPLAYTTSSRNAVSYAWCGPTCFADRPAKIKVCDGHLLAKVGLKLFHVKEKVYDNVDLVASGGWWRPSGSSWWCGTGFFAWVLTHHVDPQVLQMNVLLRGQGQKKLIAQQVVVKSQFL